MDVDKKHLRHILRQRRNHLSPAQQRHAARQSVNALVQTPIFRNSQCIGGYLPNDGELNPVPALSRALEMGKKIYLPVLHPLRKGVLWFAPWQHGTRLITNRFGIPEPDLRQVKPIHPQQLDLVLVPVVGIDTAGNRLGMGGGFYDRSFSIPSYRQPTLVGLAHQCQCVEHIPTDPWDITLHSSIIV